MSNSISLPEQYNTVRNNIVTRFEDHEDYSTLNDELENFHDERLRTMTEKYTKIKNNIEKELNDYKQETENLLRQLDIERENRIKSNKSIHNMSVLRQALNRLVWTFAKKYTEIITSSDFNTMTQSITYKTLINDSDDNTKLGMKYALLILNSKFNEGKHLSIDICSFYFTINKLYHPKIKPKTVINNSINELKDIIHNNLLPSHYSNLDISKSLLEEIQEECNNNL